MLPKISAALSRFVKPIQTSSPSGSAREREFVRTQPEKKAKIIPLKGREKESDREQDSEQNGDPGSEQQQGGKKTASQNESQRRELGSAFLQLFSSLGQHRASIFKWLGIRGYQSGARATRKTGRLRKGAMLDVKAD